jgi:hypothetical protein
MMYGGDLITHTAIQTNHILHCIIVELYGLLYLKFSQVLICFFN